MLAPALPLSGDLHLHPGLLLTSGSELPAEAGPREAVLDSFALPANIAWVPGIDGALRPFWLHQPLADRVANALAGGHPPRGLSPVTQIVLMRAGILVDPAEHTLRRQSWIDAAARAGGILEERRYLPISRMLHPFHLAELRRYYRYLIRSGRIPLGDSQCSRRYGIHSEPAARFFHHQLGCVVGAFVGRKVKPSYVYAACYQEGAELAKHTDREQCKFSLTLCLDYTPEPQLATPWPLHLESRSGRTTVFQALGDALLYFGCEVPHYRTRLLPGHTSTSIFFHYVEEDFSGELD
jgi:hypothetical protein